MIRLVGIAIVALGFALRFNLLLVVLAAAFATGIAGGLGPLDVLDELGRLFVANRYMTLPVLLIVPVVGLLERYGLRERVQALLADARAATAGRILLLYSTVRQVSIAFGVKIGDHASMVRPLVAPMAEAAARARHGELPRATVQRIRANAAAAENVGNFFGEDVFVATSSILLMQAFFQDQGLQTDMWKMALWGIPTAVVAFGVMVWRTRALDARVRREVEAAREAPAGADEAGSP